MTEPPMDVRELNDLDEAGYPIRKPADDESSFGGNERQIGPSDSGKADAHELLAQCGVEDVSGDGRVNATPEDAGSPSHSIDDSRS